jgi:hypothetical protein
MSTQYRVTWRWRTDAYHEEYTPERRKVYDTERGARIRLEKLNRNGGKYEHYTEHPPTVYDDGFGVEHWQLDYARLEVREVGPWSAA